jgi:multidrug efflux pump subunit AcrA (membrane-fusion protein)
MPRFIALHRRSLLIVIGLLLAVAASAVPRPPVNHYLTATVSRMNLEDTVLATGTIKALREVSVGAQVSGQVKSLKVALGQSVKKGDKIDPRTQENSLEDAQASVSSYQSQLKSNWRPCSRRGRILPASSRCWASRPPRRKATTVPKPRWMVPTLMPSSCRRNCSRRASA